MSSVGSGEDGDQEQERQRDHGSHSGVHDSIADILLQFQLQGAQVETIPSADSHTILAYTFPAGQATGFATTHTQTEDDPPIATPANANEEGHFTQGSASDPDEPTTAEDNPTVVLPTQAAFVKQEKHPPVDDVQPQPAYNLSDIYGQGILTHGPIPPPRQVTVRGAQSAVAHTPKPVVHMGNGLRITETLLDATGLESTRRVLLVVTPSGSSIAQQALASAGSPVPLGTAARARQREAAQPVGPSQQYTRPPSAANTQQPVAAEKSRASICRPRGNLPTEAEILLTPATEAETVQHYEPETYTPKFNPVQPQQTGLAVQQDSNPPTEDDMTSEAGANSGTAQPSIPVSGEDESNVTICPVCKGVRLEHNPNEERELSLHKQVSVLPTGPQMLHASSSASDVLPVAQSSEAVHPVTNVAERHGANYPTGANLPPQQLKAMENEGSTSQFANPTGTYKQDKSSQVNIGLEQQEEGPIRNPNNAQRANTVSYNNPGTSSQMPSTAGDTHEVTQRESRLNSRERLLAEAEKIFKRNVPDSKLRSVLAPVTKLLFSDWSPRDDTEAQQLERSLKCVEYLMTKEREGRTSRRYALQSESEGEARAAGRADTPGGDRPIGGSPPTRGRQDSPQPGQNSGAARSCAGGGTGPTAVRGLKRHSGPNEESSPAAKKQQVGRPLGTEVQCVPPLTIPLPQKNISDTESFEQETVDDTLGSGTLSTTNRNILSCHLGLDETGTQAPEGEDGRVRDDGSYVTAVSGEQQMSEEQGNDSPSDVGHADKEESLIHENDKEADGVVRTLAHRHEIARDDHYAAAVEPSTSDGTPTVETQQSQNRHSTRVGREFTVESQCAECANISSVQPSGSLGNQNEVVSTPGNIPNRTSSGAPVTPVMLMRDGQEEVTEENCVVCQLIKQEEEDDYDVEEESDNFYEETENEHEPVRTVDNCSSGMVSPHAEDRNVGNDVDLNVPAENKADQDNAASSVGERNVSELNEENQRSIPPEDMDHDSDDDVICISFGLKHGHDNLTL